MNTLFNLKTGQVLSEGKWVAAVPIPGTILINVGDLMQFWTGDRYLATVIHSYII